MYLAGLGQDDFMEYGYRTPPFMSYDMYSDLPPEIVPIVRPPLLGEPLAYGGADYLYMQSPAPRPGMNWSPLVLIGAGLVSLAIFASFRRR